MPVHIIPAPQHLTTTSTPLPHLTHDEYATLTAHLTSWAPHAAAHLTAVMSAHTDTLVSTSTDHTPRSINATLNTDLTAESYQLTATHDHIALTAADQAGAFYAINALIQALRTPGVEGFTAHSTPTYPTRGVMLDLARHFFGVDTITSVIDVASAYGLNRLHLHLSDDQGWRIEIDGHPALTERASANDVDGGAGGYLTLADYEAIQQYAAAHAMTVVPEIDLPGHTHALQVAYPQVSPDGKPREPYAGIDVGFSWVNLTADATWVLLDDIVGSLARTTHGEYVHVGGDEVKQVSRPDYEQFMGRLGELVAAHGKKLVVWQEAAGSPLPQGTQVQYWTHEFNQDNLAQLADTAEHTGVEVIASPAYHTYLDLKPVPDFPLGLTWAGLVPLRAAYEWTPAAAMPVIPSRMITGVETCLWTETIRTPHDIMTMLLPRLPAVASVAWGSPVDYPQFVHAIATHHHTWWQPNGWSHYPDPDVPWQQ